MSRRALAIVFGFFLGAPLIFLLVGLALPSSLVVERSTFVPAPPVDVFSRLDSAGKWASYQRRDRGVGELDFQVTGLESGVGSGLQYYLSGKLVATFVIRRTESPRLIEYGFSLESAPLNGRGAFIIEPAEGGTRLTRRETANIGPDPIYRWMALLGLEDALGSGFEEFFSEFERNFHSVQ